MVQQATVLSHPKSEKTKADPEVDDGGPCKWGPLQPPCCQRFRNAKCVLFWLCWVGLLQGIIATGLVNSTITTIERRFELSSTESGLIVSCYQVTAVICLLPVSYFGGLGVKPRYLAVGVFIVGLGSLLLTLPHFTTGLYIVDVTEDVVCNVDGNTTSACVVHDEGISNYKYVFILAQLLLGAGASPFYTLGITYLDDNLPQRSTSLYVGIYYANVIVGAAIGYLAGGELLNIWTDIDVVDTTSLSITPDNRRWVGAWWLGFLISGFVAILITIPISGFPRALPGSSKYRIDKNNEVNTRKQNNNTNVTDSSHRPEGIVPNNHSMKKIWQSTKLLLTNPTFMFINLVSAAESMAVTSFSLFGPKFLESQFGLTAGTASQYIGFAAVPAGAGGTCLGGFLVKYFDLKVPGILKGCIAVSFAAMICILVFLINCGNVAFAGITVEYQNNSSTVNVDFLIDASLDNQCNTNCGCPEEDYHPVCGKDGIMYFSPCYAGCQVLQSGEITRYSNCSCIDTNATEYMAEFTSCGSSCVWLPAFLPVFALMMFLTFLVGMPSLTATLRCVPDDQRSFALGIQWLIVRCLGAIPGPIIFGKMIDLSCLLWQERCDGSGSCFFYDNKNMSYYLMSIGMVVKTISTVFFFLALILYKKPPTSGKVANMDVSKPDISSSRSSGYHTGTDNPVFDASDEIFSVDGESKSNVLNYRL